MEVRKAQASDIDTILVIYARARKLMQETGNGNQWIDGYPSRAVVESDIQAAYCHICTTSDGTVAGVFYFRLGNDPTYARIDDGHWLNEQPYGVVHRLAASGAVKGVAAFCLQWCFEQCGNIRVDTHHNNLIMQHVLKQCGFKHCGTIYIANGTSRLAYHKVIGGVGETIVANRLDP